MRITHVLLSLGVTLSALNVVAQVEDDDMYFTAKDREKLRAAQASEAASIPTYSSFSSNEAVEPEEAETVNPTDSYSSRDTNPEFAARSIAETAQEDEANYFVNDYQYAAARNLQNFNDSYSSWSNNPMYNTSYYGSTMNNWNSPYYGSNSGFYSPWGNPYWGSSGWSMSMSYGWGSGYGYGHPYGYGYNPYGYGYGYNPYGYYPYGAYYGGGYYGSGYGCGYPGTIVVVNNSSSDYNPRVTYGKRPTRGSAQVSPRISDYTGRSSRTRVASTPATPENSTSGRVSTNTPPTRTTRNSGQTEYYSRSWKSRVANPSTSGSNSNGWSGYTGDNSDNNSRFSRSSNSGSTYTPSRNSGNSGSTSDYNPPSRSSSSGSGSSYTPPSRSSSSGSGSSYSPPSRSSGSSSGGGSSSGSSGGGSRGRTRGN